MRVYALTKLGKKMAATKDEDTEEMKVIRFIRENKTATSDELEGLVDSPRVVCRRLKERSLVQELTT